MSLYSTKIESEVIDPRVDIQNNRCEFKLIGNGRCYYPNMRLVNIGCSTTTDSTPIISPAGLYGLIKHIHLRDGSQNLATLRFANRYLAFNNLQNTNYDNENIHNKLAHASSLGFHLDDSGRIREYADGSVPRVPVMRTAANYSDLDGAYLDLRKCFGFLESVNFLDTNLFKNLNLLIEWDTDSKNFAKLTTEVLATQPPQLIVDEITDDKLKQSLRSGFKGAMYTELEHDVVQVPEVAAPIAGATNKQSINLRIKGYDNKLVGRLLAFKNFSNKNNYVDENPAVANTVMGQGAFDSRSCIGENVNFRVNGAEVFSGGLDSPAKRAMVLAEAWGDLNIAPYANSPAQGNNKQGTIVNTQGSFAPRTGNDEDNRIGQSDYIGVDLSSRINQLSMDFSRVAVLDAQNASIERVALDVNLYAEVQKTIVVSGGGYSIKYV